MSVRLKCVSEGSKLRIRIISPGYYNYANCQFPKDIRVLGRLYECEPGDVKLVNIGVTYYYRIKKSGIRILDNTPLNNVTNANIISVCNSNYIPEKIYTDDNPECSICLTEEKAIIFVPCGHFATCNNCDKKLPNRKCPICRKDIRNTITPEQMSLIST